MMIDDGSMGVDVVVNHPSPELIEGSTLDFVNKIEQSSFAVVENAHSECAYGCGSSFTVPVTTTMAVVDPPRDAY